MNPVDLATGVSVITPERLENLCRAVRMTADLPGDMAELGVYRGGSAKVIAAICPEKTLHLFDTFAGLPCSESPARDPDGYVQAGMFSEAEHEVRSFLAGHKVMFHVGVFPRTANRYWSVQFSFCHVDCDLYDGARDAIEYFWPRLSEGGIIFFDDYGCKFTGVTEAVREAFTPEQIVLQYEPSTGVQIGCYVVKQ